LETNLFEFLLRQNNLLASANLTLDKRTACSMTMEKQKKPLKRWLI
jgi:hypothetical protein